MYKYVPGPNFFDSKESEINDPLLNELDLANLKVIHSMINNKILCRIAIAKGNESQRLREEVKRLRAEREVLEKERDDSFDKGYEVGIKEIDRFRYTYDGRLAELVKSKTGEISRILFIGDRHPLAGPLEEYRKEFDELSSIQCKIDLSDVKIVDCGPGRNSLKGCYDPVIDFHVIKGSEFPDSHPDKMRNGTEQKKVRKFNNRKKKKPRRK